MPFSGLLGKSGSFLGNRLVSAVVPDQIDSKAGRNLPVYGGGETRVLARAPKLARLARD